MHAGKQPGRAAAIETEKEIYKLGADPFINLYMLAVFRYTAGHD